MSEQQPQTIQPQMPSIENEDNILQTLFGYFATFVRPYLWLYPTAVILFLAGGILFLRTATPIYSSTAEMMIASNEMRALDVKGIADPSYGMAGEAFIKTQIQVIQSSEVLSKVYERLGEEASSCSTPSIVRIPGTNLVNITVKSVNPEAAAKFANTVAEVYVDFMYRRKITISSTGANLLRDQLKEVQVNRDKAMEDLLKFKEIHGIYDLKQSYNALVNQRNELETKLFEAKMDCEEIATTLDEVKNNRDNAVVMLPYLIPDSNSNLTTLQHLLLTHEMKLPELLTNYNKEHQAVKVHEEVKQMIQNASEAQVNVSLNGLKLKLQRVQRRCDSLQSQINEKEQELIKLDKIGGDYRMREAACEKLDETITMITSRINELQIADATTIGNYNISKINDAKPAKKPVFPQPQKVLGLAFLGGLAFAALISFILVSINNKVTEVSQITQAFNESVPVFGSIPLFSNPEGKLLQSNGEEPVDEVFRDIRTSLNLSMMTRNTKIIAVTSALPYEGKTFMTCNLARSFARDNKRILLLELDLRKPRLHRLLKDFLPEDVEKRQGVSNVLVGDCQLEDVVIHIDQLKIDVALAGPLPPNPNELIGSVSFQKLLEKVQSEYDITFIDTPPVVAVSDTLLIAQPNVSLILVSRLFYLPKPVLMHLRNRLLQLNIKLAGLVCNNVDVPKSSYSKYGYGYGYGYKYGYGYGYKYGYGYGYKYGYGYGYGKGSRYSDRKLPAQPSEQDNADNAAPPAQKKK